MTAPSLRQQPGGEVFRATVMIVNRRGLHARAAAKFVKLAAGFDADITVSKRGQIVSALSILGLMMLAAGPGTELEIAAQGREAAEAVEVLTKIIKDRFDED